MQGLQSYNDHSPPSSPPRRGGPSRLMENNRQSGPGPSPPSRSGVDGKGKMKATESDTAAPERASSRRTIPYRDLETPTESAGPSRARSQSPSEKHHTINDFDGCSEEEILRLVTRPDPIEGVEDWGIPAAVDSEQAPDALKAKVKHFLRLKHEGGQHINSTLLSSSSFANPHIYAKLVEFVDIDETATAFPLGGWMTRRAIEDLMPDYGPKALAATQKARQDAIKRSQEAGKRSNIQFAPGRRPEGASREGSSSGVSGSAKKRSREDEYRDRYRSRGDKYDHDRRDRDRRDRR